MMKIFLLIMGVVAFGLACSDEKTNHTGDTGYKAREYPTGDTPHINTDEPHLRPSPSPLPGQRVVEDGSSYECDLISSYSPFPVLAINSEMTCVIIMLKEIRADMQGRTHSPYLEQAVVEIDNALAKIDELTKYSHQDNIRERTFVAGRLSVIHLTLSRAAARLGANQQYRDLITRISNLSNHLSTISNGLIS